MASGGKRKRLTGKKSATVKHRISAAAIASQRMREVAVGAINPEYEDCESSDSSQSSADLERVPPIVQVEIPDLRSHPDYRSLRSLKRQFESRYGGAYYCLNQASEASLSFNLWSSMVHMSGMFHELLATAASEHAETVADLEQKVSDLEKNVSESEKERQRLQHEVKQLRAVSPD